MVPLATTDCVVCELLDDTLAELAGAEVMGDGERIDVLTAAAKTMGHHTGTRRTFRIAKAAALRRGRPPFVAHLAWLGTGVVAAAAEGRPVTAVCGFTKVPRFPLPAGYGICPECFRIAIDRWMARR